MPEIKLTGKKTKTGEVLGASEASIILMGKSRFKTPNQILAEHRKAKAGVEEIDKPIYFNKAAMLRGSYLEHAIVPWYVHTLKDKGIVAKTEEPTKAFLHNKVKLGATLDRIITITKGSEVEYNNDFFTGKGAMEVKTDYDFSGCRMEWKIQLNAQMLCANLPWGVIVCFDGVKGKLHAWYFRRDKALCEMIEKATNQFWIIVDDPDDSYPEPEKDINPGDKVVVIDDHKSNVDLQESISKFQKAQAEESCQRKIKKEQQEFLEMHMDSIDADVMIVNNTTVKSTSKRVPKEKMVDIPGEYTTRSTFKISTKEETHD